jgi:hypothetical protein
VTDVWGTELAREADVVKLRGCHDGEITPFKVCGPIEVLR